MISTAFETLEASLGRAWATSKCSFQIAMIRSTCWVVLATFGGTPFLYLVGLTFKELVAGPTSVWQSPSGTLPYPKPWPVKPSAEAARSELVSQRSTQRLVSSRHISSASGVAPIAP